MVVRFLILSCFFLSLGALVSCTRTPAQTIIVLALDRLPQNRDLCQNEDETQSGVQMLCNESIRFTHHFTSSTQSLPAMTTLLTGQYPFQHRVRNNQSYYSGDRNRLLALKAKKAGYRTYFSSGSPSILKKSQIQSGFEVFDDQVAINSRWLFKPFSVARKSFNQWMQKEVSASENLLSVFYISDLAFQNKSTQNEFGEKQSFTYDSQLKEFDRQLALFISDLKAMNRWQNAYVLFVGLNGYHDPLRVDEIPMLNLQSENTQTTALIKLAQKKKKDFIPIWKIDRNISLADFGTTLDFLVSNKIEQKNDLTESLHPAFENKMPPEVDRIIPIESGWTGLNRDLLGKVRAAFITGKNLVIYDETEKIYNFLQDHDESQPLFKRPSSEKVTFEQVDELAHRAGFERFADLPNSWKTYYNINFNAWVNEKERPLLIETLKKVTASKEAPHIAREWLSRLEFEKNYSVDSSSDPDAICISTLINKNLSSAKNIQCNSAGYAEVAALLTGELPPDLKDLFQKKLTRLYLNRLIDFQVYLHFSALSEPWDLNRSIPLEPSFLEKAFKTPQFQKIKLRTDPGARVDIYTDEVEN